MYSKQIKLKSRSVPFRKQISASPWLSGVSHPGRVYNYMRLLTLAFLLIAGSVTAQTKKTNTIVIHGISEKQAIDVFKSHGYLIAGSGSGYISTVPQKSKDGIEIVLQMQIKDSTGYLRGRYDGKEIRYGLWKFSESYAGHYKGGSFEIMDLVAKAFGRPVTYESKIAKQ